MPSNVQLCDRGVLTAHSWFRPPVTWREDPTADFGGYRLSNGRITPDGVREIGEEIIRLTGYDEYQILDRKQRPLDPNSLGNRLPSDLECINIGKVTHSPRGWNEPPKALDVMVILGSGCPALVRVILSEPSGLGEQMAEFVAQRASPAPRTGLGYWIAFAVGSALISSSTVAALITTPIHPLLYPLLVVLLLAVLWVAFQAAVNQTDKLFDPRGGRITVTPTSREQIAASRRTRREKTFDYLYGGLVGLAGGLALAYFTNLFGLAR